jgi:hypothetical protein
MVFRRTKVIPGPFIHECERTGRKGVPGICRNHVESGLQFCFELWVLLRGLLRYLSNTGAIPKVWDEAPPGMTTRRHVHLPRQLSREQVEAPFDASQGKKTRALRDRALLFLFLRPGLPASSW